MASTFTPQNAIDVVRKFIRDVPATSVDYQLCDIVHSKMWRFYPWRWSQSAMTAIALVDGQQDYVVTNTDVYRHLFLSLSRTDITPREYYERLSIYNDYIPDSTKVGPALIRSCAVLPLNGSIRLKSAVQISGAETWELQGRYQRNPTKITPDLLNTAWSVPDQYFEVFVEGLKWKFYDYTGNEKAGAIATDRSGRKTYSGQLGVFMQELSDMASDEDYGDEEAFAPDCPLGVSSDYF